MEKHNKFKIAVFLWFLINLIFILNSTIIVNRLMHIGGGKLIEGNFNLDFYVHKFTIFSLFFFLIGLFYLTVIFAMFDNNIKKILHKRSFLFIFLFIFTILVSYNPRYITGDEIHYLNLAKSVASEHNFEISEFKSQGHFFKNKDGKLYSIHYPFLSLLISVPQKIGEEASVKLFMGFIWFLLTFIILKKLEKGNLLNPNGILIVILLFLAAPFSYFSGEIYPEVIGSFIIITLLYLIENMENTKLNQIIIGVLLSIFLWTSIRFYSIAFLLLIYYFIKKKNVQFYAFFILGFSFLFEMYVFYLWYGLPLPWAMYVKSNVVTKGNFLKGFLGLFFDQQSGIFIIAPIYILIFAGIVIGLKKDRLKNIFMVLIFLFYILPVASSECWNAHWSPSGRFMFVLMPIFIIWILYLFKEIERHMVLNFIFNSLLAISLLWGFLYNILPDKRNGVFGKEGVNFFIYNFSKITHINLDFIFLQFYNNKIFIPSLVFEILLIILINIFFIKKINSKK